MGETLLVVSASLANRRRDAEGPRKDYELLAQRLGADLLDRSAVDRSVVARVIRRLAGVPAAQAWLAFRKRGAYRAIVTDGEHVGIPLALLLRAARARAVHVTIGHRLSASKKRPFFRFLKAHLGMTRIAVHASMQYHLAAAELGIPRERLALVPYQVDTAFWRPLAIEEEPLICSAGLEFRDYPTLIHAVAGLDVRLVLGASSHWSRRRDSARDTALPANVEVGAFDYVALRALYARAAVVVVPLEDVDFQAGVTTILEAMAMGKPVIVSHTRGQTDVVEDRRAVTRGTPPRSRPTSLLRVLGQQAGVEVQPNGLYVLPNDPAALRRAIVYLLNHPEDRRRLGAAGRRAVASLMTVEQFAERMGNLVDGALAGEPTLLSPQRREPAAWDARSA